MAKRSNNNDPRRRNKEAKTASGSPSASQPTDDFRTPTDEGLSTTSPLNHLEAERIMAHDAAIDRAQRSLNFELEGNGRRLDFQQEEPAMVASVMRRTSSVNGDTSAERLTQLLKKPHSEFMKKLLPFHLTFTYLNGAKVFLQISICSATTAKIHNNPNHPVKFNSTFPFVWTNAHNMPRTIGRGGLLIAKHAHLATDGWLMIQGACVKPLEENWESLKKLAEGGIFDPFQATFTEVELTNEDAVELLEHVKMRNYTKIKYVETDMR